MKVIWHQTCLATKNENKLDMETFVEKDTNIQLYRPKQCPDLNNVIGNLIIISETFDFFLYL